MVRVSEEDDIIQGEGRWDGMKAEESALSGRQVRQPKQGVISVPTTTMASGPVDNIILLADCYKVRVFD